MHIELWAIDRPKPYPKNARQWNVAAVAKVAASILEYGFRQSIVVDVHDVIIIGHLRLAAAKTLALKEVPVHVARELTPAKMKGLRLMDNRSHEESTKRSKVSEQAHRPIRLNELTTAEIQETIHRLIDHGGMHTRAHPNGRPLAPKTSGTSARCCTRR